MSSLNNEKTSYGSQPALFADRGFTGHEFLPWFNLYNMNGRLYDPLVGRFLNADPVIQDPGNTQNYNRYSYCLNNPLKYVDLNGENQDEFWLEDGPGGGGGGGGGGAVGGNGYPGGGAYDPRAVQRTAEINASHGYYTPSGGGKGAGSAGVGGNGNGDNGAYYDYSSGSYRSTSTGIDVGFSTAYNTVSQYFDNELAYSLVPYAWVSVGGSELAPKAYRLEQTPGSGSNFSLAAMYRHFQVGGHDDMHINASSIDFSGTSQRQLGLSGMKSGDQRSVNLFKSGINSNSLAFGKVEMIYRGNNQFAIVQNMFDFNIEWQNGFSARNAGTVLAGTINYNLMMSPAAALVPLIFGGPYNVYFNGSTYIPK